jgi:hypothetical protein
MTTMTDLAGYVASTMTLLTFMTKDVRLLRALGIFSNIAFITYGALAWLPPVFCLHLLLLPVNVLRLRSLLVEEGLPTAGPVLVTCAKFFDAILSRLSRSATSPENLFLPFRPLCTGKRPCAATTGAP